MPLRGRKLKEKKRGNFLYKNKKGQEEKEKGKNELKAMPSR